jgi:hypothetical protein|tara:strand:+ start:921 stop:1574 length:654 start_codon:yes stop_codon:yes gene_type:complete
MKEVKITKMKSEPKKTFFAPEYDYNIFETQAEQIDFKELAKFILTKEKEILSLPATGDAYTGMKEDSTTTRFDKYNVFKWENENIKHLKGNIINFHNGMMKYFNQPLPKELYIQCWTNIMRKGEQIKPHIHDIGPNCYLGGHICVQCDDTSTHYINPVNQINDPMTFASKNDVGKMTIFPNNIPHYTDIQKSDKERITIAFDLITYNPNKDNYVRLI